MSSPSVRRASMKDFDAFLDIMVEAYTTTEPVAVALKVTREEAEQFVRSFLPHYLPLGYSLLLEYDGQPQGIFLLNVINRSDEIYDEDIDPLFSPKLILLENMARSLSAKFWDMMPLTHSRALHGLYAAIRPQFHGKGGLAALTRAAADVAYENEVEITLMECINEAVVEAYRPMGFITFRSIPFSDWSTPDGKPLNVVSLRAMHLIVVFVKPTWKPLLSKI